MPIDAIENKESAKTVITGCFPSPICLLKSFFSSKGSVPVFFARFFIPVLLITNDIAAEKGRL
jgi:hypothetical protein